MIHNSSVISKKQNWKNVKIGPFCNIGDCRIREMLN